MTTTSIAGKTARSCWTMAEYKKKRAALKIQNTRCEEYLKQELKRLRVTQKQLAKDCGVSENTIHAWLQELPHREAAIGICMGLGYDSEETNVFLQRCGFAELYPRSASDVVWLYLIHSKRKQHPKGESAFGQYDAYCQVVAEKAEEQQAEYQPNGKTKLLGDMLFLAETDEQFLDFVERYRSDFTTLSARALHRLEEYCRLPDYMQKERPASEPEKKTAYEDVFYRLQGQWDYHSLRRYIQEAAAGKVVLHRDRLITLGLKVGMDIQNLNGLLESGGFSPLRARDFCEGSLIMLLSALKEYFPEFFVPEAQYDFDASYTSVLASGADKGSCRTVEELLDEILHRGKKAALTQEEVRLLMGYLETDPDGGVKTFIRRAFAEALPEQPLPRWLQTRETAPTEKEGL